MNRSVITAILTMLGKAILITVMVGVVIGIIGRLYKWDTSIAYSNAFFIAGCLAIIAGASSRLGAGEDWKTFQLFSAESFRHMSSGERAKFIVDTSSPIHLVILGGTSGVLLILISWLILKLFQ